MTCNQLLILDLVKTILFCVFMNYLYRFVSMNNFVSSKLF